MDIFIKNTILAGITGTLLTVGFASEAMEKATTSKANPAVIKKTIKKVKPEIRKSIASRTFLAALKESSKLAVLESGNHGQKIVFTGLSDGSKLPGTIKVPRWLTYRVRRAGKYLIPVKEVRKKWYICGSMYHPIKFDDKELKNIIDTLGAIRKLKAADEASGLKKILLASSNDSFRMAVFDYLYRKKEFNKVMKKADAAYWSMIYFNKNTSEFLKRRIMMGMAKRNFMPDNPIFIESLKNKKMAVAAGRLYMAKDKKFFKALMLKWIDSPELYKAALYNSEQMVTDLNYVNKALKHYKSNSPLLKEFIPVLCASPNKKYHSVITSLLHDKKRSKRTMQNTAIKVIVKMNSTSYLEAVKAYVKNQQRSNFFKRSYISLSALAFLCKNDDIESIKNALERIAALDQAKGRIRGQASSFCRAFRAGYNGHLYTPEQFKKSLNTKLQKLEKASAAKSKPQKAAKVKAG